MAFLQSCSQDPIFWMVSNEVAPKDPLISGSPSKIIKCGNDVYVANGKLWKYSQGAWSKVGGVPSNIFDIAAAGSTLYMLSITDENTSVYKTGSEKIENTSEFDVIQGLYSNGSAVFAGAMKSGSDEYAILNVSGNSLTLNQSINSPLTGAAGSYFATARNGIYNNANLIPGSSGYSIAGIISTGSGVIAVTGTGNILEVTGSSVTVHAASESFTGALCVYKRDGITLLLLGVKSSVYDMGYREMKLNDNFQLSVPGDNVPDSTVSDRDKYRATLAKCAVNSIFQLEETSAGSDKLPVLLASTQKDGLWSYRENEWNAEE